jgi:protein FRA10AC1
MSITTTMALQPYASASSSKAASSHGTTEFDILKASHKYTHVERFHFGPEWLTWWHRFLREDDEVPDTWEDKLASKYYESLYREYAVCDLKHYKSGNVRDLLIPDNSYLYLSSVFDALENRR